MGRELWHHLVIPHESPANVHQRQHCHQQLLPPQVDEASPTNSSCSQTSAAVPRPQQLFPRPTAHHPCCNSICKPNLPPPPAAAAAIATTAAETLPTSAAAAAAAVAVPAHPSAAMIMWPQIRSPDSSSIIAEFGSDRSTAITLQLLCMWPAGNLRSMALQHSTAQHNTAVQQQARLGVLGLQLRAPAAKHNDCWSPSCERP